MEWTGGVLDRQTDRQLAVRRVIGVDWRSAGQTDRQTAGGEASDWSGLEECWTDRQTDRQLAVRRAIGAEWRKW